MSDDSLLILVSGLELRLVEGVVLEERECSCGVVFSRGGCGCDIVGVDSIVSRKFLILSGATFWLRAESIACISSTAKKRDFQFNTIVFCSGVNSDGGIAG